MKHSKSKLRVVAMLVNVTLFWKPEWACDDLQLRHEKETTVENRMGYGISDDVGNDMKTLHFPRLFNMLVPSVSTTTEQSSTNRVKLWNDYRTLQVFVRIICRLADSDGDLIWRFGPAGSSGLSVRSDPKYSSSQKVTSDWCKGTIMNPDLSIATPVSRAGLPSRFV
jgi:hypothetical protein